MSRAAVAVALALGAAVLGCASVRDVFSPYTPAPDEVAALVAEAPRRPRYDAALVLGCPANPDGTPSPCQRCRVAAAVAQWRAGHVGKILVSGGAAHSPEVEADVMGELAVRAGVAPGDILRERRALTTWQNVRFALKLARAARLSSLLVISTADHLPRARRFARFWGLADADAGYLACDGPGALSDASDTR